MTWYAFTVTPQLERRAWDGLATIHCEPARLEIPRIYRSSGGRGRRTIIRPLIPGYAIANVAGRIPWALIRMIEWQGRPIIDDVLKTTGDAPAVIPAGEIERLMQYLVDNVVNYRDGPGTLRPGARARVAITRYGEQETVISRVLSASKCTVMMRLFNSDREVVTSTDRLREAG